MNADTCESGTATLLLWVLPVVPGTVLDFEIMYRTVGTVPSKKAQKPKLAQKALFHGPPVDSIGVPA